jgi:preprotein translocase subunit SecD
MLRKLLPLIALLSLLPASFGCARLFKRQQQGPQDKGGIFLVIAVKEDGDRLEQSIARTISVIESRCNQMAIYCKLERQGGDHVMLRVSSDMAPERIKDVLLSRGLEMRAVVSQPDPYPLEEYATEAEAREAAGANDVLPYYGTGKADTRKRFVVVERLPIITGDNIRDAHTLRVQDTYEVIFNLDSRGAARIQAWTRSNINKYLAVILNGEARSVAVVRGEISDSGVIASHFTREQAEDIAHVLITGNLPAPLELVREGTYKP